MLSSDLDRSVSLRRSTGEDRLPGLSDLRVCVVTEELGGPADEGIRNFALFLVGGFQNRCQVMGISIGGPVNDTSLVSLPTNKLLLSRRLKHLVANFQPHVVCYVPSASDTVFSFLRLRILATYWSPARTALIALQPRRHTKVGKWAISLLDPSMVFVQSAQRREEFRKTVRNAELIPSGVDLDRFRPVSPQQKQLLRKKYDLPTGASIVLHVGHITRERNVEFLAEVQQHYQVLLVCGNSVGQDRHLTQQLRQTGVAIVDSFLEHVEEVYELSDCYLFPVTSQDGCIEVPLSVLEAMACNLPVVTTRYGGLETLFAAAKQGNGTGFFVVDTPGEALHRVAEAVQCPDPQTRDLVQGCSWQRVADCIIEHLKPMEVERRR